MIVVTGGAGFIGRYVVSTLVRNGFPVRVVDNLVKKTSNQSGLDNVEFMKGDLLKTSVSDRALEDAEVCIHLAARIGGVKYFHDFPATILDQNSRLLSNIFNSSVKKGVKKVVYISSSMVFEQARTIPTPESAISESPPPFSHYGFSKLQGEYFCTAYWREYGLKYVICRPFNAYGAGEMPEDEVGVAHVIPDLIRKILKGDYPLEILGDGKQTRCFSYVQDIADAICLLTFDPRAECEDFNIGNSRETSIMELARMLWRLCDRKEPFKVRGSPPLEFDVPRRVPDISKIVRLIGWKPKVNLEEGLPITIQWIKDIRPKTIK